MVDVSVLTWVLDQVRGLHQARRRVKVTVHLAYFQDGSPKPFYFVKVTNLSSEHDVVVMHVWFDTDPPVHILLPERPLPKRLAPDDQSEVWAEASRFTNVPNVELMARARLTTGKVIKSRPSKGLPEKGFVA